MREFYVRILTLQLVHDLTPQNGHFENIGFVYGAQFFATLLRSLERNPADAANFRLRVGIGVVALTLAAFELTNTARLAKVDTACELTHNHDIQTGNHLGLEGGCRRKLRIK